MKALSDSKFSMIIKMIIAGVIIISSSKVFGQKIDQERQFTRDHLFQPAGTSTLKIVSGVPYIGIIEYSYAISDKFSLGVMLGATPHVEGYGIRIRAILYQPDSNNRIYFKMPMFYYPKTKHFGDAPWSLIWPVVNYEKRFNSDTRLSAGVGFVQANCLNSLLGREMEQCEDCEPQEEQGFEGGIWNTIQFGVATPLSNRMMFHSEVAGVMSGFAIAGKDYVGGPPIIVVFGVTYAL